MKKSSLFSILFLVLGGHAIRAQTAGDTLRAYAYRGWQHYKDADYAKAEKFWRQAIQFGKNDTVAYDLAQSILQQNRTNEALENFLKTAKTATNDSIKAKAWHNAGNIYFHKKQYEKALEAYKNALRANPDDEQTRYNYALTKKLLNKQKKQNKNNKNRKNKNQNRNQKNNSTNKNNQKNNRNKNQDKPNQRNQNQNDQNKRNRNKHQEKSKQNQGNQKNKEDKNRDKNHGRNKNNQQNLQNRPNRRQEGEGQKRKSRLSPEEAKRLLQALKNKEEQTLKKVKARPVKGRKVRTDKDW